jgi:hypothetical protein
MRKWQAMLPVAALIAASGCQELPTEEEVGGPQAQAVTVEAANSEQEPGSGSASRSAMYSGRSCWMPAFGWPNDPMTP